MKYTLHWFERGENVWRTSTIGSMEEADAMKYALELSAQYTGIMYALIPAPVDHRFALYFHNGKKFFPELPTVEQPIPDDAQRFLEGIDPKVIRTVLARGQKLKDFLEEALELADHFNVANTVIPYDLVLMTVGVDEQGLPLTEVYEDEIDDEPDFDDYEEEDLER